MWKIEKWKDKKTRINCSGPASSTAHRWLPLATGASHLILCVAVGDIFFLKMKMGYFCAYCLEGTFSLSYWSLFHILSHWKTFGEREWERRQLRFCAEACFSGGWLLSAAVGRPLVPDHGPIASSTGPLTSATHFRDPKHWINLVGAVELMIWKKQVLGLGTSS